MTKTVIGVTVPANTTKSEGIDLRGLSLRAIETGTINGTTITFESTAENSGVASPQSDDTEIWLPVHDDGGTQVSVTVASNRITGLTAAKMEALAGLRYIRLVMGTAQNPARQIRLICTTEI